MFIHPVYGKQKHAFKTLNRTYQPLRETPYCMVNVMWTHSNWGIPGLLVPNHCVPVVPVVDKIPESIPACQQENTTASDIPEDIHENPASDESLHMPTNPETTSNKSADTPGNTWTWMNL